MAKPVLIITVFLGCGKTSFLRRLLRQCGAVELRPALVINEVGDVDVDGELLADLHAEQARLVGGCVCCTLQAQLSDTIYDLLERDAGDLILIECSGLSNPLDVLGVLTAPAMLREVAVSHIVCLLDAVRAPAMLKVAEVAKQQVAAADIILLNKQDRLDPAKRPEVEALVRALNPHAALHWTTYGDLGDAALRGLLTDPAPVRASCACGHAQHDHHHHELPASFCTTALPLPPTMARAELEALLHALPANVLRAKGFAYVAGEGWHMLHRVFDAVDVIPFTDAVPASGPLLVCIGQQLDVEALRTLVEPQISQISQIR